MGDKVIKGSRTITLDVAYAAAATTYGDDAKIASQAFAGGVTSSTVTQYNQSMAVAGAKYDKTIFTSTTSYYNTGHTGPYQPYSQP